MKKTKTDELCYKCKKEINGDKLPLHCVIPEKTFNVLVCEECAKKYWNKHGRFDIVDQLKTILGSYR
jgi:uncharacterized protein with PIN domain